LLTTDKVSKNFKMTEKKSLIVIKIGGSEGIDLDLFCTDYAEVIKSGTEAVLVHGGSNEANIISEKLGHPPRMVTSVSGIESRYTDRETLEILAMVFAGKINKIIVERLQKQGVNAVGISGIDGRLMEGIRKSTIKIKENGKRKILRGDYTGKLEKINKGLLTLLLDNGYAPVISPLSISYEGDAVNVDADRAAAMVASALNARQLIILSNVPGLLKDINDESSLITEIPRARIENYMSYAKRRMKKKVMGAIEALDGGVEEIIFADARISQPITMAMERKGTVIK